MIGHRRFSVPDDGEPLAHQERCKISPARSLHKGPHGRVITVRIDKLPARVDRKRLAQFVSRIILCEICRPQRRALGGLQAEILALGPPASARGRIFFHAVDKVQPEHVVLAVAANLNAVAIAIDALEILAPLESLPLPRLQNRVRREENSANCQNANISAYQTDRPLRDASTASGKITPTSPSRRKVTPGRPSWSVEPRLMMA